MELRGIPLAVTAPFIVAIIIIVVVLEVALALVILPFLLIALSFYCLYLVLCRGRNVQTAISETRDDVTTFCVRLLGIKPTRKEHLLVRSDERSPLLFVEPPPTCSNAPYRSSPLRSRDQFRVLILSPGSFGDPLQGELMACSIARPPSYDALSYTWADETGDATKSSDLTLKGGAGSIRLTKNCDAAMRRLRRRRKARLVWIDAICIDQDSDHERTYQVSIMSQIFTSARRVIVYTGEGTPQTDRIFDWLNGLSAALLDIPPNAEVGSRPHDGFMIMLDRYRNIARESLAALFQERPVVGGVNDAGMSRSELVDLVSAFFSRRWFRRVWVLQEAALPDPGNTSVICGTRAVSAMRALHLLSLVHSHPAASMARIFVLVRAAPRGLGKSYLLDILIETRDRESEDPRDKIFGILSIANLLDRHMDEGLRVDYAETAQEVFTRFSTFFIRHHGPGFFLSLLKSESKLPGLPSWAADWSVPWPNYKAVAGKHLPAATRSVGSDSEAGFVKEGDVCFLTLNRPRILNGYFTRSGHVDGADDVRPEKVEDLREDEVLIEMYPGLAVLLARQNGGCYTFIQACPHHFSESGVEELAARWARVVTNAEGHGNQLGDTRGYLGPVETFKIC
ncbi:hypothetical protein MAPG_11748 [Magnaporthiopsis poae ATCC 64411]|uniref:Heterokaryon incompatibility domain-containing protein n=1 Tax=Magnaporthiopsis poae (strain ATCC 64411 / 73-15) TaxID=644358 RepID=A0A0C4EG32_MAGP6|nr:hypothetical protein MAPG_11748 [Magnaporthiopsis poae ATCC 64411]